LRVVYVSSLPKGGPVAHLRVLAPAVTRAGAEVHVLCLDERVAESFRLLGVDASVVPLRHKADLAGARQARRLAANADVVHTQDRRSGLLVRPLARLGGAGTVHTYHGLPEELGVRLGRDEPVEPVHGGSRLRTAWLLHGYLRAEVLLSRFGAVVVPSQALARFLTERGLPASRLHVIPHGIDAAAEAQEPTGSGDDVPTVGVASNLEHEKGVDVLIQACALVKRPIRVEVLGDGACRDRLERLAAERGVDVQFAGHVEDVRRRLSGYDIFVLPSRAENFPVAALEAMAAGLPVVATRVGGVPELVVDQETGLIVEPESPVALAEAIDSLAGERSSRRRLGDAGARRVRELFDADHMASRMLALYESLG
jgi:glycosyltransferase involved in cell wall biosynthesis